MSTREARTSVAIVIEQHKKVTKEGKLQNIPLKILNYGLARITLFRISSRLWL